MAATLKHRLGVSSLRNREETAKGNTFRIRIGESQGRLLVLCGRITDPDPRAACDGAWRKTAMKLETSGTVERMPGPTCVKGQRGAHAAGSWQVHPAPVAFASLLHDIETTHDFGAPDQHGGTDPIGVRHNVQESVNSIAKEYIRMAGRTPHGRVAFRLSEAAVRSRIARDVGLDLRDAQTDFGGRARVAYQQRSE